MSVDVAVIQLPWLLGQDISQQNTADAKKAWIAQHPDRYKREFDSPVPLQITKKEFEELGVDRQKVLLKDHEAVSVVE